MFNKKKRNRMAAGIICLVLAACGVSGCSAVIIPESLFNSSTSYFNEYEARSEGDNYLVSGTVHQSEDNHTILLWVEADEEISIPIKGTMTRRNGELKLVYEAPDKTLTVLADSGQNEKKTTDIDEELKLEKGGGLLRFDGEAAVFDFDLSFGGRMSGHTQYFVSKKEMDGQSEDEEHKKTTEQQAQRNNSDETGKNKAEDTVSGDSLIDQYDGAFTEVPEDTALLKLKFAEKTQVRLKADLTAEQIGAGALTLGQFQLRYVDGSGKTGILTDHQETDHALAGFWWESHYDEIIELPEGTTEIMLSSVRGKNYRIGVDIQIYETSGME